MSIYCRWLVGPALALSFARKLDARSRVCVMALLLPKGWNLHKKKKLFFMVLFSHVIFNYRCFSYTKLRIRNTKIKVWHKYLNLKTLKMFGFFVFRSYVPYNNLNQRFWHRNLFLIYNYYQPNCIQCQSEKTPLLTQASLPSCLRLILFSKTHTHHKKHKPGKSFLLVNRKRKRNCSFFLLCDRHLHPTWRASKHVNLGKQFQGQKVKSLSSDWLLTFFFFPLSYICFW